MTNDNPTAPSVSSLIFETNASLRCRHLLIHNLRSVVILVVTYIVVRLCMGRPLLPVSHHDIFWLGGLLAFFVAMSFATIKWGTAIQVTGNGITLMKGGQPKQAFGWADVESFKPTKQTISFILRPGNKPRGIVIGKHGFPADTWKSLNDCVSSHYASNKHS